MIFACVFSNNVLSTIKSVIHFVQQVARYHDQTTHGTLFNPFGYSQFRATSCTLRFMISLVACILMHDRINHGTKQSAVIFACIFSDNVLSTVKSVIHFVQLVARMIQPWYAIHWFSRSVHLDARMIQPRYVIRDSLVTCILMHERFNLGACLMISCNKLHATISGFVHQDARYDPRFRATSCTLRFPISCNELNATGIILDINFVFWRWYRHPNREDIFGRLHHGEMMNMANL